MAKATSTAGSSGSGELITGNQAPIAMRRARNRGLALAALGAAVIPFASKGWGMAVLAAVFVAIGTGCLLLLRPEARKQTTGPSGEAAQPGAAPAIIKDSFQACQGEFRSAKSELGQLQRLLADAVARLTEGFNNLNRYAEAQRETALELAKNDYGRSLGDGASGESLTIEQFVRDTSATLNSFVDSIVANSREAMSVVEKMDQIKDQMDKVSAILGEITAASMEQSSGIEQVNQAITQMDQVTQQNAALVEQVAAAAESLQDQAQGLINAVAVFKLEHAAQAAARTAPAAARRTGNVTPMPAKKPEPAAAKAAAKSAPRFVKVAGGDDEWEEF